MEIVIDTGYYSPEEIKDALYSLLSAASDISVAHYLRIMKLIKSMEVHKSYEEGKKEDFEEDTI